MYVYMLPPCIHVHIHMCTCTATHTHMLLYTILAFVCVYVHTCFTMDLCTHTFLLSAAPPSRPGFNGGMSSPSRGPFSSPTQLSQATLYPISSLNPYQSKWTIRVRVASKPSIREWSNSRGQGKVFNVDLVDESVSTIGG